MTFAEPIPAGPLGAGSAQLILYAIRLLAGALPWGEGTNQLCYEISDLGATDAAAPAEMLALGSNRFWLRDPIRGSVYLANPIQGTTQAVDLHQAVGDRLASASPSTFAWATTPKKEVVLVVGGRPNPTARFRYALCFCTASGIPHHVLPLDVCSELPDAPNGLGITSQGDIWILYPQQAILLDGSGSQKETIAVPGILLSDGLYLTKEQRPRLFGADGRALGSVEVVGVAEPIQFLAAGPDDVLLAPGLTSEMPERLQDSIHVLDLYRLDRHQMKIRLHDRLAWPALALQAPSAQAPGDALPVKSYFPPGSTAFDPAGDLWILEHTPAQCRFHVFRRLRDVSEWARKFARLDDLNAGELELYRAEAQCRLGLAANAGSLSQSYTNMVWMGGHPSPPRPTTGENLLRALDGAKPAPERR